MRTRSGSTEPESVRLNALPGHSALSAGGRWFNGKFMKLFRSPRGQEVVTVNAATDGRLSTSSEEEEEPKPVSPTVIFTFEENLEQQLFFEASQLLREREELLFGDMTKEGGVTNHKAEVDSLIKDYTTLKHCILQTLLNSFSLNTGAVGTEALRSAVKAVHQEHDQDQLWKQRSRTPPSWRPGGWMELHAETLRSLVEDRMDNPPPPPPDHQVGQSSIMVDICSMGKQLKDDLKLVVGVLKTCYPPETNICGVYARLYHQTFSTQLRRIADFGLELKDCTYLLRWVNEFYPELLQKPELACEIDAAALGKLLPREMMESLEKQYLSDQQTELMTFIGRVLTEAREKWIDGEEPTKEDGYYVSPVAYDIIQCVNGKVTSAGKVLGDLQKARNITCKLNTLIQRFKTFQDDVVRLNRRNSKAIIKANLGCIEQFRMVLEKNSHLFVEGVRSECLSVLAEMKASAHSFLLNPMHEALKPQYRKLGTSEWLKEAQFKKLVVGVQGQAEDLQGLNESCHQELICRFHEEVTVEYVKRLLRADVKLKDRERQTKAYDTVKDNAESLHELFVKMGSDQDWLREILTTIAEVLKLQDLPAIQMQVAWLGSTFPDFSEKHVTALLKLKTNFSRADRKTVKETLMDTLKETGVNRSRPFFSKVEVK